MRQRVGFTLIEIVVVVMIIGILVAIAAPRMLNVMGDATDNSVRQSLDVVRGAIEEYATQNGGAYPTDQNAVQFKNALKPYLRGPFPSSPVGGNPPDKVTMSAADPLVANNTGGWTYNGTTGEFIINCTDVSEDGSTTYDQF